jgi:hypothetical protein
MDSKMVNSMLRSHWEQTWDRMTEQEPLTDDLSYFDVIREARRLECPTEADRRVFVFNNNQKQQLRIRTGKRIKPKSYLSVETYAELKSRSGGKCEICGCQFPSDKATHIDHCHKTGRIRGVLCSRCNVSLERVEQDPLWGKRAFVYLALHENTW